MYNAHILRESSRAASAVVPGLAECRRSNGLSSTNKNVDSLPAPLSAALQIFRQPTFCTLLILCYFFSLTIGLRDGEPQILYLNDSSTFQLATFPKSRPSLSETINSYKNPRETDNVDGRGLRDDDIKYLIQRTTVGPEQLAENVVSRDRNQSKFVQGNTASVIASSFRNIDSQTTNSKEDEIVPPSQPSLKKKPNKCQRDALKKCIDGLPPMNDTGIPTSPEAVERACRIYDSGISCFDSWAKNCLPVNQRQMVRASITGAHEMYSFLCKDTKFRNDYLKHKECYRQLSPYWDDCSRQFIDGLRKNIRNNYTAFCCIRLEFVTCVSKFSSRLCSLEATKFSMKMAETLIRTRTRQPLPDCIHIHPKSCIPLHDDGSLPSRIHPLCVIGAVLTFLSSEIGYLRVL